MSQNETEQMLQEFKSNGYIIPHPSLLKTPEQIEGIRESAKITTQILDLVEKEIKEGMTTAEVDKIVYDYTISRNAIPAPLNYMGFPKSVCLSINEVVCHGIPDNKTVLKSGDIVNVDVSTILNGYFSDASRMCMIGDVTPAAKALVETTKECLDIGTKQVKPFKSINEIGRAIEPFANQRGYTVVRDLGGHGVGLKFHEDPHIDHFAKRNKGVLMLPGMVFTIEPMINEGGYSVKVAKDNWTVTTRDGSLSAQWEYTIAVTKSGYEILAW
ncbi:methionyl aminopeptidase [Ruminiclostridium sufflavum DSM 19573]|uniref:Methionine aminopeptidase n=2 Tax=Ruminiclostridium TaxID=1508657 RepID=A0A318XIZ1_9FIRM|nr:type I methionyl aminopeptidase [Ruminiclostridium sufflavum]PYG87200.1 methionyl aminopeptidase [Ruminiclostridium sufflavum DSM 19573]